MNALRWAYDAIRSRLLRWTVQPRWIADAESSVRRIADQQAAALERIDDAARMRKLAETPPTGEPWAPRNEDKA